MTSGGARSSNLRNALSHEAERLQAAATIMAAWNEDSLPNAVTAGLHLTDIDSYVKMLKVDKLSGPVRDRKSGRAVRRHVFAAIPVARLLIKWDANDRVRPPEPVSTSGAVLLPTKWNKQVEGAWRMDLDAA